MELKNINPEMLLEIKTVHNFGYYFHLLFWLVFLLSFSAFIFISPGIGVLFIPIIAFAFYEKVLLHIQNVNIQIFKNNISINGINYEMDNISFHLVKGLYVHDKGVFKHKGKKIMTLIISSLLSPSQTKLDGDGLEKLIQSLKSGNTPYFSKSISFENEVKTRVITTVGLTIIALIMLIPLIFLAMVLDIPLF